MRSVLRQVITGLVSILLDAMSAVGLCCCDSPLRLRRCAPVTLDPSGQSEGEVPRKGPAPLRQANQRKRGGRSIPALETRRPLLDVT